MDHITNEIELQIITNTIDTLIGRYTHKHIGAYMHIHIHKNISSQPLKSPSIKIRLAVTQHETKPVQYQNKSLRCIVYIHSQRKEKQKEKSESIE